jgi:hypothetical protein
MVMVNDRRIVGLWTNSAAQNSHVYVRQANGTNEGWKKCRPGSSDAVTNMTIILAHAKAGGRIVNFNEDPAGQIEQAYVW